VRHPFVASVVTYQAHLCRAADRWHLPDDLHRYHERSSESVIYLDHGAFSGGPVQSWVAASLRPREDPGNAGVACEETELAFVPSRACKRHEGAWIPQCPRPRAMRTEIQQDRFANMHAEPRPRVTRADLKRGGISASARDQGAAGEAEYNRGHDHFEDAVFAVVNHEILPSAPFSAGAVLLPVRRLWEAMGFPTRQILETTFWPPGSQSRAIPRKAGISIPRAFGGRRGPNEQPSACHLSPQSIIRGSP
jgi:hypothetical protein